jgi:hypothetical protein
MNAALFSMPSVQRSLPSRKDNGGSFATALLALSLSMLSMKSTTSLKPDNGKPSIRLLVLI